MPVAFLDSTNDSVYFKLFYVNGIATYYWGNYTGLSRVPNVVATGTDNFGLLYVIDDIEYVAGNGVSSQDAPINAGNYSVFGAYKLIGV